MRPLALLRTGCLLLAMGAIPWPAAFAFVDPPSTSRLDPRRTSSRRSRATRSRTLERGQDFERRHNWSAAIQVYRDANDQVAQPLRVQAAAPPLRDAPAARPPLPGRQLPRDVLLRLPREKAFDLFDELVERIEIHYVDAVPLEPLIRRGFDNLEVALRDPQFAFLTLNAPNATPERVAWLRDQLRARRERLVVPDRETARDQVVARLRPGPPGARDRRRRRSSWSSSSAAATPCPTTTRPT